MVAWLLVMHLRNWGKMKNLHQFQIPYTGNEKKERSLPYYMLCSESKDVLNISMWTTYGLK
jgi:hypothetical protein